MALGKLTQDKIISETVKNEFGDKFIFESPILYFETENNVCFFNIETSNLGRTTVTNPKITFKEIEKIVNPIFKEYSIPYSKWSSGLQNPNTWKENIAYLHTDSEEELFKALDKIIPYIREFCVPFWEKYQDVQEVLDLIDTSTEEEMNQGLFQGAIGIMTRLAFTFVNKSNYFSEKTEFYKKLFKEYSEKKPEQYLKIYLAFTKLIEVLEGSKSKPV